MAEGVNVLTLDQRALVMAVSRVMNEAGIDFVLIAGKDREGAVMSNICFGCAIAMLNGALNGAEGAAAAGEAADWAGLRPTLQ